MRWGAPHSAWVAGSAPMEDAWLLEAPPGGAVVPQELPGFAPLMSLCGPSLPNPLPPWLGCPCTVPWKASDPWGSCKQANIRTDQGDHKGQGRGLRVDVPHFPRMAMLA